MLSSSRRQMGGPPMEECASSSATLARSRTVKAASAHVCRTASGTPRAGCVASSGTTRWKWSRAGSRCAHTDASVAAMARGRSEKSATWARSSAGAATRCFPLAATAASSSSSIAPPSVLAGGFCPSGVRLLTSRQCAKNTASSGTAARRRVGASNVSGWGGTSTATAAASPAITTTPPEEEEDSVVVLGVGCCDDSEPARLAGEESSTARASISKHGTTRNRRAPRCSGKWANSAADSDSPKRRRIASNAPEWSTVSKASNEGAWPSTSFRRRARKST
mmetsp:Transcript_4383/g.17783  ORF Transcript_4383/g.17783 Transcript_4383/m.17783 type:complete len:279 (-) Transcript_4383:1291-2127(-)